MRGGCGCVGVVVWPWAVWLALFQVVLLCAPFSRHARRSSSSTTAATTNCATKRAHQQQQQVENGRVPGVVLVCRNGTDTGYYQRLSPYPRVLLRRASAMFKVCVCARCARVGRV